ncbi:hypothetical protein ACTG9Q_13300 [Actinokineospora sp. 24-640]
MTVHGNRTAGVVRRRAVINGDPSQIAGSPMVTLLHLVVLTLAAGADVVTFHQILMDSVDENESMLWILVAGFTTVCIALSHLAGQHARQVIATRHAPGARVAMWTSLLVWAALGATAFLFRLNNPPEGDSGLEIVVDGQEIVPEAPDAVSSPLLFLVLYIATGAVSAIFAFIRHHPAARQYARALARRTKAAKELARIKAILVEAQKVAVTVAGVRAERDEAWMGLRARCEQAVDRLKHQAALDLLAKDEENRQIDATRNGTAEQGGDGR